MARFKAIMFRDNKNPVSIAYSEYAKRTWEAAADLFEIETVQCITPDSPVYEERKHLFNPVKKRSPGEICIYLTYFSLWEKAIADGTDLWTLEHDACFKKPTWHWFEKHTRNIEEYNVMLPGGAVEMVYMSAEFLKFTYDYFMRMEWDDKECLPWDWLWKGPMGLLFHSDKAYKRKPNKEKVVAPVFTKQYNYRQLVHHSLQLANGEREDRWKEIGYFTPSWVDHVYCFELMNTRNDHSTHDNKTKERIEELNLMARIVTKEELRYDQIVLDMERGLY